LLWRFAVSVLAGSLLAVVVVLLVARFVSIG
jgi:hypothetical protein